MNKGGNYGTLKGRMRGEPSPLIHSPLLLIRVRGRTVSAWLPGTLCSPAAGGTPGARDERHAVMGCGASSRATVAPEAAEAAGAAGAAADNGDLRLASAGADSPPPAPRDTPAPRGGPLEEAAPAPSPASPRRPPGPPTAFEVPVLEESLIKKHPPRRFQRLEEQQLSSPLSLELLEERQAVARHRRIQILNQRVLSAKLRLPKKARIMDDVTAVDDTIESVRRENSSVEL
ncbi:uncharacterized protein LOC134531139 [Bacillus rossius redtenbacheri]|uniref:uncharacterized protein LOC134531139 n=1 Tax=Bacillus rossius redtenbacheri TaxID=93214 RepID=UPI002FDE5642